MSMEYDARRIADTFNSVARSLVRLASAQERLAQASEQANVLEREYLSHIKTMDMP